MKPSHILFSSLIAFSGLFFSSASCIQASGSGREAVEPGDEPVHAVKLVAPAGKAIAAFAEGCFWHSEIIFESLQGVDSVVSGYAGGKTANPGYEEVSSGETGHAESALIYYDPKKISFAQIVNAFFLSHDPTQVNRQNNDVGTQYRSVAFYQTAAEKSQIETAIAAAKSVYHSQPIATQVLPLKTFYRAEGYHQNYIAHHPHQPYVMGVCIPEYHEFRKVYKGPLKPRSY